MSDEILLECTLNVIRRHEISYFIICLIIIVFLNFPIFQTPSLFQFVSFLFAGFGPTAKHVSHVTCVHCGQSLFVTPDLKLIADHCRKCRGYARVDAFKQKFVCFACPYPTYHASHLKRHMRTRHLK